MSNTNNTEEGRSVISLTTKDANEVCRKEVERVTKALRERLESHDENRKAIQEKLHRMCEKWRKEIDEQEKKVNCEIEERHSTKIEDIQKALEDTTGANDETLQKLTEAEEERRAELERNEEKHASMKKEIDDLEEKINNKLEAKFKEEDSRLQAALNGLQGTTSEKVSGALQKAKAELLVMH